MTVVLRHLSGLTPASPEPLGRRLGETLGSLPVRKFTPTSFPRPGHHPLSLPKAAPPLTSSGGACPWVSRLPGSPLAFRPPTQACRLGSIVPRGSVQCK